MPFGDAVQQRPTVEQEMAKFKTYAMTDGEVSDGAPTDEEKARLAADEAQRNADKAAAGKNAAQRPETTVTPPADEDEDETPPEGETPEEKAARETAAATGDGKKPNKLTAEERVKQAVRRQRQAERERDSDRARHASDIASLTARLTTLEKGGNSTATDLTGKTQPATAPRDGRPDPRDFEFGELDAKYIETLTEWKVDQRLSSRERSQRQETLTAEQARSVEEFQTRKAAVAESGAAKYDDFDEVVFEGAYNRDTNPTGWLMSDTLGKLALTSPVGHEVLYHLATNPKEAAEVFRKDPMDQAAYFGRLEAKFSSSADAKTDDGQKQADGQQQKTPPVKTPQAPPPPNTKGKGAGAKSSVSADTNDFSAFERMAMGRAK